MTPDDSALPPLTPVHVAHGGGAYANTRAVLERMDLSSARGKRVLLKPNAGREAAPGQGITTDPQVVAAAIDAFREAGGDVAVGESPIMGVTAMEAFESTGIAAVARDRDCPLLDMDARPCVEVPIPDGRVLHELRVCPDVVEADMVVSIPVMKMHMHTGATLSVKNMKGCLWRRSKVGLHMLPPVEGSEEKSIDVAITDMSSVLRADLAIVDGTVGMEGLGPSAGQPKALDVVVASTDPFAADAVACQLMGTQAEAIPHLRMGGERGYGVIDLERIAVAPDGWRAWASPFVPAPQNLTIEFPGVTVHDCGSCSACQSTLMLFLTRYSDQLFDYFPEGEPIHVAIGTGNPDVPDGTLCIGNCMAKERAKGIFVPGCPPVGSQILTAISGRLSVDSVDGHGPKDETSES